MRIPLTAVVLMLLMAVPVQAQTPEEMRASSDQAVSENKPTLSALINYQINGANGLARFIPEIFLGFDTNITGTRDAGFNLRFGPTISSAAIAADSTQRLRALATPGNFNIGGLVYRRVTNMGNNINLTVAGGAAIKAIASEVDTVSSILQHNLRLGAAAQLGDYGFVGVQHTWGWHDITEESKESFEAQFGTADTKVTYVTVTASGKITEVAGQDAHIFATWSRIDDAEKYPEYARRARTLRIGIRADLCMLCSFPAR